MTIQMTKHNPKVQDEYNELQARGRELRQRIASIHSEQEQILTNLGALAAEGCDFTEYTDKLAALRAEAEALECGVIYLRNQGDLMKRLNPWLVNR